MGGGLSAFWGHGQPRGSGNGWARNCYEGWVGAGWVRSWRKCVWGGDGGVEAGSLFLCHFSPLHFPGGLGVGEEGTRRLLEKGDDWKAGRRQLPAEDC